MRSLREHVQGLKYKPYLTEQIDTQRQQAIEEMEKIKEEKKRISEKVGNYAKYVKEMYWPKVSQKKRDELTIIKQSLKTQIKRSQSMKKRLVPSLHDADSDGFADLDLVNALHQVESVPNLSGLESVRTPQQKKKLNWGKKKVGTSPIHNSNPNLEMIKSVDYLKDQRQKRELEGYRPKIIDDKIWDKYLKDQTLSEYEKVEQLRKRAMMVEQRAQMDEKLARVIEGDKIARSVEKTIAVNDMYLEAIQAKLKLLDKI